MNVMDVVSRSISFRGVVRDVEVDVVSGEGCALLAEELARVEKACAAVRALAAARAAACGAHRERGYSGAEDWLAGVTGSTRQQAKSDLETGARLADCPATKDAAIDGDLSLGQADEIAKTEQEKPGSESELVEKAKTSTRPQLADECRKRRQEGVDREELSARQHQKRSLRKWTDADGMLCGLFRLEPAVGIPLLARLEIEADRLHREAKRQGRDEPWEAHAADALVAMLGGTPGAGADDANDDADGDVGHGRERGAVVKPHKTKADVVFVVDLRTFREGEHEQSLSHIIGGGPVPVAVVREMAKHAFLKVVFHDGVNIHTVSHVGRHIPAELRTALEVGKPPDFDGIACSGCGRKFRLQWDHLDPVCAGGVTSYENEDPKCWDCHAAKSEAERASGLYARPR